MQTLKKIFIISVLTLSLIVLSSSHASSSTSAPSEDFMHGLIRSVQITFERGAQFYQAGEAQKAQVLFDQCHYLLLAADEMGDEALQRRIDRVFETFYRELAGLNPDIAGAYQEIQIQVQSTFEEEPVYAGQVRYYVDYLVTNKSSFLKNSFRRAYQYLPMIRQEFAAAGIPEDLAYMALIESGFRPDPVSHAEAKGLWQFMPATAERFGMKVHGGIDERTDPSHCQARSLNLSRNIFLFFVTAFER